MHRGGTLAHWVGHTLGFVLEIIKWAEVTLQEGPRNNLLIGVEAAVCGLGACLMSSGDGVNERSYPMASPPAWLPLRLPGQRA